jgi:GNAT superfamily N-acetyltransferase
VSETLEFGVADPDEEKLVERRALETLVGFLALRWRRGWAGGRSHCFVARLNGEVVSSIMALDLPLYWPVSGGGTDVREVAGLDALVTPLRHRRRGYAGRLLEWVNQWATDRGMAGTALFSEIGTTYYTRRGYRLIPMSFYRGPLPGVSAFVAGSSEADLSVAEQSEAGASGAPRHPGEPYNSVDLPRVAAAYSVTARRYPLAVARDLAYWEYQLDHSRFVEDLHSDDPDPRDFTVATGGPTAYVRSRNDGDIFTVLEAVCEPGAEATLEELLSAELARGVREGCLRLVLHMPPEAARATALALRETPVETFLVRPAPDHAAALDAVLAGPTAGARPYIFRPDYF